MSVSDLAQALHNIIDLERAVQAKIKTYDDVDTERTNVYSAFQDELRLLIEEVIEEINNP